MLRKNKVYLPNFYIVYMIPTAVSKGTEAQSHIGFWTYLYPIHRGADYMKEAWKMGVGSFAYA